MMCKLTNASSGVTFLSRYAKWQQHSSTFSDWTSMKVRAAFIDFYKDQHHHEYYPPCSVIPAKGSGIFFTNAGMNQFKPIFLGQAIPDSPLYSLKRAVNSQKCIRLSGKHNDLADVGHDTTHHTFFEMLGNWSFGDYFKREAMAMAWQLMTEVYRIPPNRLYVTYFGGEPNLSLPADFECRDLWLELGVDKQKVIPGNLKDNFWEMGDTGPCGPCTEIHYDFIGGRNASHLVNMDDPNVVELWNLVFMQYNRVGRSEIEMLPSRHIDTGMGLERLVSVLQNKRSNYDTDLFTPILQAISQNAQCLEYSAGLSTQTGISYRIVADHARMMCVSIADGIMPGLLGLDGLCVKLRQIMHRLFRHHRKYLGCPPMSVSRLVDPVIETLGEAFPELTENHKLIVSVIEREENSYYEQISDAYTVMEEFTRTYPDTKVLADVDMQRLREMSGDLDLSCSELLTDLAEDYGLSIDRSRLNEEESGAVNSESNAVPAISALSHKLAAQIARQHIPPTDDSSKYVLKVGTDREYGWASCAGRVVALSRQDTLVNSIDTADGVETDCVLITDKTCFYAEGGGQAADRGHVCSQKCRLVVTDVQRHGQHVIHHCKLEHGRLAVGEEVQMDIDQAHRTGCAQNHTSTHLLFFCMQRLAKFGVELQCTSSSVTSDGLSLSFTCQSDVTMNDLSEISREVNKLIAAGIDVTTAEVPYSSVEDVKEVTRLPDILYPSTVQVVGVGPIQQALQQRNIPFPADLCGGTHVVNTSDIKAFVITSLIGQTQGVKKLTALTGDRALEALQRIADIETLSSGLIDNFNSNTSADTWDLRLKEIYKNLSEGVRLPKVQRELLVNKLEQTRIPEKIRSQKNIAARNDLQQTVAEFLLKSRMTVGPAILETEFPSVKHVGKILRKLCPPTPVYILHKYVLVCYCPLNQEAKWLKDIAAELGSDLNNVKAKNMSNIYIIKSTKNSDIISEVIERCERQNDVRMSGQST